MSSRVVALLRQSVSPRRNTRKPKAGDGVDAPLIEPADSSAGAVDSECCVPGAVSQRWVLAFLLHAGLAVTYAMRVALSVAAAPLVRMQGNHTNATFHSNATMYTEFGWSATEEGVVLGAFFQGYIVTQTISAVLARRFGGKKVLAASMACSCALTWLTPVVAASMPLLVACRVCLGLMQGAAYPATLTLVGKWYTAAERASFLGFIIAGPYLGEALTFPLAPIVMQSAGWRYVFYLLSLIGGVWLIFFVSLVRFLACNHGEGAGRQPRLNPES
jgi:MFS family permease